MISGLSLTAVWAIFALAGLVVLVCGTRMTGLADRIADRTGFGEAMIGGVLLGAATSLSGSIVSITAALEGRASLAFSNGIGGIAAQTAFLALADLIYRRANLEHASAELVNVFQTGILMLMLSLPFVAWTLPEITLFAVHPASLVLLGVYVISVVASHRVREEPMWQPTQTDETRQDAPEDETDASKSPIGLIAVFTLLMLVLGVAGYVIAQCAAVLTDRIGLSSALVGALFTAVVTSMPELVTTIAAVRRGALQLAVGGIIGGNTFDTLFLTFSDISYRDGSLYHAVERADFFWASVGMVMTTILLLGLLMREKRGAANIGWESAGMLVVYLGAVTVQGLAG